MVNFIGEVADARELAKFYANADVFLLTSRFEGYPLSVVEAGYSRSIPIVSRNSGADDLIENNVNGYIYRDAEDAVRFIKNLIVLTHPAMAEEGSKLFDSFPDFHDSPFCK